MHFNLIQFFVFKIILPQRELQGTMKHLLAIAALLLTVTAQPG